MKMETEGATPNCIGRPACSPGRVLRALPALLVRRGDEAPIGIVANAVSAASAQVFAATARETAG